MHMRYNAVAFSEVQCREWPLSVDAHNRSFKLAIRIGIDLQYLVSAMPLSKSSSFECPTQVIFQSYVTVAAVATAISALKHTRKFDNDIAIVRGVLEATATMPTPLETPASP